MSLPLWKLVMSYPTIPPPTPPQPFRKITTLFTNVLSIQETARNWHSKGLCGVSTLNLCRPMQTKRKSGPFLEGALQTKQPHMGGWWFMMTLLIFENDDGGWWLADIQPKDIKPSLTSRRVGHPVRHPAESDIQQVSMKSSFLADISEKVALH